MIAVALVVHNLITDILMFNWNLKKSIPIIPFWQKYVIWQILSVLSIRQGPICVYLCISQFVFKLLREWWMDLLHIWWKISFTSIFVRRRAASSILQIHTSSNNIQYPSTLGVWHLTFTSLSSLVQEIAWWHNVDKPFLKWMAIYQHIYFSDSITTRV